MTRREPSRRYPNGGGLVIEGRSTIFDLPLASLEALHHQVEHIVDLALPCRCRTVDATARFEFHFISSRLALASVLFQTLNECESFCQRITLHASWRQQEWRQLRNPGAFSIVRHRCQS